MAPPWEESAKLASPRRLPEYRITGLPDYRNTGLPDYRNTGIPDYRNTGLPAYRLTGFTGLLTLQIYWFLVIGMWGRQPLPTTPLNAPFNGAFNGVDRMEDRPRFARDRGAPAYPIKCPI